MHENIPINERLRTIRAELKKRHLDGFIIPHTDEYQGEYVPPSAQRLAWATGFTGSAGLAIVSRQQSAIFVDGRYILAVHKQVDQSLYQAYHSKECAPEKWIRQQPPTKLGYDPWLQTPNDLATLQSACDKVGSQLISCETNPIDTVWTNRPAILMTAVFPHPIAYAGETSLIKRHNIAKKLADKDIEAVIMTAPESIAWLLNIRGSDVPHAPLPLCVAILYRTGAVTLFLDSCQYNAALQAHLGNTVTILPPNQLETVCESLKASHKNILLDPKRTAIWFFNHLKATQIIKAADPCLIPKACKNAVEIAGSHIAHHHDGIALIRFLHWMETAKTTEIGAADQLTQFRSDNKALQDISFETISAVGSHAAMIHYQVTPDSNQEITPHNLYLVDSGGQYLEGTTDVTRTIAIGTPTSEQKQRFTLVLKGHIQLASCRFPKGTTGTQLDVLARQALWQAGLDFEHGTGHGVGSYLSVHEGPQNISPHLNNIALKPGMILSNEPGYYKENAYGIRIENLMTVLEAQEIEGGEQAMLCFETLTRVPIDLTLIEPTLLNRQEKAWLNRYHQKVFKEMSPLLTPKLQSWLENATRPI